MYMDSIDRWAARTAAAQHGVIARGQVLAAGGTDTVIRVRLRSGRWERHRPGVYRLAGSPDGHFQRLWSAHLAAGRRSVVSHEAAGALHRLAGLQRGPIVLTLPHPEHARLPGATVHQISDLEPCWVWRLDGLPVTTSARTVVDLAALLSRPRLERVLDDGLAARRLSLASIASCLFQVLRPGKRGLPTLATMLDERGPGHVPPASELERLLFAALTCAGLPEPRRQFALPGRQAVHGRVDAAYPDARLILEADGRRWHSRQADFARDRQRDNEAARAGWQTLRFTWEELVDEPHEVGATVRAVRAERLTLLRGNSRSK